MRTGGCGIPTHTSCHEATLLASLQQYPHNSSLDRTGQHVLFSDAYAYNVRTHAQGLGIAVSPAILRLECCRTALLA